MTLADRLSSTVILADRNAATSEGIRALLETEIDNVYLVANTQSLVRGMQRLNPEFVVLDASMREESVADLLRSLLAPCPEPKIIMLVNHPDRSVADTMLSAGAHAVVLKRCAGSDLFQALQSVTRGEAYVSPEIGSDAGRHPPPQAETQIS